MSMDDQGRLSKPASPIDLDDLLSEILLRLPPLPSSLPRASLVCTRWRRLVTDPSFVRRFRAHHWRPLGVFFSSEDQGLSFRSISDPRYPAPSQRFSVRVRRECQADGDGACGGGSDDSSRRRGYAWVPHGCRHGRVVLSHSPFGHGTNEFLVWNPVTGEDHFLDITRFLDADRKQNGAFMKGAVISAAGDKGPFKFSLAWDEVSHRTAHICVYSSETGVWGDVVSAAFDSLSTVGHGNVMVGNTLYWIVFGSQLHILQLDLGTQNLAVIEVPPPLSAYGHHCGIYLCTLAGGGGPSLIVMAADLRAQLWVWETTAADSDGGGGARRWMRGRTIELDKLLGLRPGGFWKGAWEVLRLEGDEEDNLIFVSTCSGVFMVHLESMQFEKVFETSPLSLSDCRTIHPLKNLYAPVFSHLCAQERRAFLENRNRARSLDAAESRAFRGSTCTWVSSVAYI